MRTHHPDNERIKRQYFVLLKEAKGQSEDSVDAVAKAIARFEVDTQHRDFKAFHFEQAVAFKRRLAESDSLVTGDKLRLGIVHLVTHPFVACHFLLHLIFIYQYISSSLIS